MDKKQIFTDMAVEFFSHEHSYDDGYVRFYQMTVDENLSKRISRPCGKYATVETSLVIEGKTDEYNRVSDALCSSLKEFCEGKKKALAVGLGNPDLTADALGDRVFKRLNVNRHLSPKKYLCALTPNVLGMTGIESYDIISAVTDKIRPDVVIAVDALTAASPERIACAFQITDSGITPGSGVNNRRPRLDSQTLGVPVVSIGVPLVVYSSTIARDFCGDCAKGGVDMIVTPKDVDVFVDDCAKVIATAINGVFA